MSPDDCFKRPSPNWVPRLFVIDGCNVGRSSCGHSRESVSVAGLLSVVRWLLLRDFECVIFLPVVYNNPTNMNSSHVHLLSKIEELGLVTFTPARASRGERKAFINYDDLYLTTMAARHGGCILSGDKFKDILSHPSYSEFHDVISNRVIDIRFLFLTYDVVHFGDDIFYRAAPELYLQEDVTTRARSIAEKIFCSPDDPQFSRVQTRRAAFTSTRRKELLNVCDDLIYEICERKGIRPLRLTTLPAIQPVAMGLPEEEVTFATMEEMTIVSDDSVWQPGDGVTMAQYYERNDDCRYWREEEGQGDEEALIDLSDEACLPPVAFPSNSSSATPLDPFELEDLQLMTTTHNILDGEQAELDAEQIDLEVEEMPEVEQIGSQVELVEAAVHLIEFPCEQAAEDRQQSSSSPSQPEVETEQRQQELLDQLTAIFPRDIVETVLAMNASFNLDFLAEQCLLLQLNQ